MFAFIGITVLNTFATAYATTILTTLLTFTEEHMTPTELANSSEHSHQRAVFAWAACAANYGFEWAERDEAYDFRTRDSLRSIVGNPYPVACLTRLFAIHNQGHGDAIRGGRAKAEGVKAGVPDMMLPFVVSPYAGLFIELKRPKQKIIKDSEQDKWRMYLNDAHYLAVQAVGWLEAVDKIKRYLWPVVKGNEKW
jgi:hypothetical protein